jgi:WD40 repeat protein
MIGRVIPRLQHRGGSWLVPLLHAGLLVLVQLGNCGGRADQPAGRSNDDIAKLVRQLGSSRFADREQAAIELSAIGKDALPALRDASNAADAEVARRAKGVLESIEKRLGLQLRIQNAVFSPDGRRVLLNNTSFKRGSLWVREIDTGRDLMFFDPHPLRVGAVDFSPDGKLALLPGFRPAEHELHLGDYTIWVVDWQCNHVVARLAGHTEGVSSARFLPDGRRVLSASLDGTLRLWDVAGAKEIRQFRGHTNWIGNLCVSPDGKRALSSSLDRTIRMWDVETGRELWKFEADAFTGRTGFSPDGKWALAASGQDTANGVSFVGGKVRLWDAASGRELRTFGGEEALVMSIAFSPDSELIATGDTKDTIRIWNRSTGKLISQFQAPQKIWKGVAALTFTPDGRTLLAVTADAVVHRFEVATKQQD